MTEPAVWPAAERNKGPILEVLKTLVPPRGVVLEIACGTGQHAEHFAAGLPALDFYPTDADTSALEQTALRVARAELPNLHAPVRLDVHARPWVLGVAPNVVYCANMIHIAPLSAMEALVGGAAEVLEPDGILVVYGPFRFEGEPLAESNVAFDASLRARDPSSGIRSLEALRAIAEPSGLAFERRVAMPANNHVLVFRRLPR
jgi:SAM-dependent methyltransferase